MNLFNGDFFLNTKSMVDSLHQFTISIIDDIKDIVTEVAEEVLKQDTDSTEIEVTKIDSINKGN